MIIDDEKHAAAFLAYCSYYRFCGYALHFEELSPAGERTHRYKSGTSFAAVEKIYHFDSALRRLIFHDTSLIEIDFRGTLGNESSLYYDNAHWFLDKNNFCRMDDHAKFLELCHKEVEHSKEIFITSYRNNYEEPVLPPIWMLTELMPFSVWSKLYHNLADRKLGKNIALKHGVNEKYLRSWLQALTVLRNACAHHVRIWNRNFTQAPKLSPRMKGKIIQEQPRKIFVMFLIIYDLLKVLGRERDFADELNSLFAEYPDIELKNLGVPSYIGDIFT